MLSATAQNLNIADQQVNGFKELIKLPFMSYNEIKFCYIFEYQSNKIERSAFWGTPGIMRMHARIPPITSEISV